MKRSVIGVSLVGVLLLSFVFLTVVKGRASDRDDDRDPRIAQGFRLSPVPLNMKGRNPDLVGLGSYLVNAVGGCNDCHTCPS
jgi:hypothetical protein